MFIIEPQMMPFPKATTEREIKQEKNLLYVAITRSKNRMVFVGGYPNLAIPINDEVDNEVDWNSTWKCME